MPSQPSLEIAPDGKVILERDWTRFAPDCSEVWVVAGDRPRIATVVNESYGGVGLVMEAIDAEEWEPGDKVVVFYYGHPMQGSLCWIQRDLESRQIHLGIQWPKCGA